MARAGQFALVMMVAALAWQPVRDHRPVLPGTGVKINESGANRITQTEA